jgi:hypothetical protein
MLEADNLKTKNKPKTVTLAQSEDPIDQSFVQTD